MKERSRFSWISPLRESVAVAAFYFLIAILFFFPQISTFSKALIGPPEDNMQLFWCLWHGTEAILRPDWPLMKTAMIYYPGGISLYYISYYYLSFPISLALVPFLSYPAIYNILTIYPFIAAGLGSYLLIRYLGGDPKSALAGGFIFGFNPHHLIRSLHHIHIANTFFIPFLVLFTIKSFRSGKFSDRFWAALFLMAGALIDWSYLIYGMIFLVLAYAYRALCERKVWLSREFFSGLWILVLAIAPLLPLIYPMIVLGATKTFRIAYNGHEIYVSDLLGFIFPHPLHFLAGAPWIQALNARMTGTDWEKTAYLGLANLFLIAVSFRFLWKEHRKYFFGLLAFMVLAMGSSLHVLGHKVFWPLPYYLIEVLPFFTNARNPNRILEFGYLFLAVLTAFSLQHLFFGPDPRWKKGARWAAPLFLAFIFLDFYSVCSAKTFVELPKAYEVIKKDFSGDFGILEIPYDGARYQMQQTVHGIPLVQGYVNRRFETTLGDTLDFKTQDLARQKQTLKDNKVKYIVILKKRIAAKPGQAYDISYAKILDRISDYYSQVYEKLYEDDEAATFRVYS